MRKCIESCLFGGEQVEVILVNDGSSDDTAKIADEYKEKYPKIIKVIHQVNKGHGGAVNAGLEAATGKYFKVVDSDDWVDEAAYAKILGRLNEFEDSYETIDLLISDFVYEQEDALIPKKMKYHGIIPVEQIVTWNQVNEFKHRQYLLMHALIFRTDIFRQSKVILPEKTFYVDNLYVFIPLQYVKTMYYLDVPFYRYFIGREDQSVNEKIMMKRIDQQLKVNRLLIDGYDVERHISSSLDAYLIKHIQIVTLISSALLNRIGTDESAEKKEELWQYMEEQLPSVYSHIHRTLSARIVNLNGNRGRRISNTVYKTFRKVAGYS